MGSEGAIPHVKPMSKLLHLAIAATLATLAATTVAPQASASCTVTLGDCTGGYCDVNIGTCATGGSCDYNIDATCVQGGDCPINVASMCYDGDCAVNVNGWCSVDGQCTANAGDCYKATCTVNLGSAAHCWDGGSCLVNLGTCKNYGSCTINLGTCDNEACPIVAGGTCSVRV
jgi:hypothetical protein